uniref:Uncharacterized protein n=1 Tax=Timema douglasi TaxID=61478 RepID=A0A7R8ZCB2_TIMDO|nr:unnamed protein product [Timema douglasi]
MKSGRLASRVMALRKHTEDEAIHPTEIRTSISPSSAVELNTTSALVVQYIFLKINVSTSEAIPQFMKKIQKSLYVTVRFIVPATWCLTVVRMGWGGRRDCQKPQQDFDPSIKTEFTETELKDRSVPHLAGISPPHKRKGYAMKAHRPKPVYLLWSVSEAHKVEGIKSASFVCFLCLRSVWLHLTKPNTSPVVCSPGSETRGGGGGRCERWGVASQPTKVSFRANKNRWITEIVDGTSYRTGLAEKSYVWKESALPFPHLQLHPNLKQHERQAERTDLAIDLVPMLAVSRLLSRR